MSNTYKQPGEVIDHTPTGEALSAGELVLIGARVGVAAVDIAQNATGSVHVTGVHQVAKLSTDVVTQGALLYLDATNDRLTTTSAGNTLAGYAFAAAASGDTTVLVKLNA